MKGKDQNTWPINTTVILLPATEIAQSAQGIVLNIWVSAVQRMRNKTTVPELSNSSVLLPPGKTMNSN